MCKALSPLRTYTGSKGITTDPNRYPDWTLRSIVNRSETVKVFSRIFFLVYASRYLLEEPSFQPTLQTRLRSTSDRCPSPGTHVQGPLDRALPYLEQPNYPGETEPPLTLRIPTLPIGCPPSVPMILRPRCLQQATSWKRRLQNPQVCDYMGLQPDGKYQGGICVCCVGLGGRVWVKKECVW